MLLTPEFHTFPLKSMTVLCEVDPSRSALDKGQLKLEEITPYVASRHFDVRVKTLHGDGLLSAVVAVYSKSR